MPLFLIAIKFFLVAVMWKKNFLLYILLYELRTGNLVILWAQWLKTLCSLMAFCRQLVRYFPKSEGLHNTIGVEVIADTISMHLPIQNHTCLPRPNSSLLQACCTYLGDPCHPRLAARCQKHHLLAASRRRG